MFGLGNRPFGSIKWVGLSGSANSPAGITIPGVIGRRIIVILIVASYKGQATTGGLILSGGDITIEIDILSQGTRGTEILYPGKTGDDVTITLEAGGAGVIGKLYAGYIVE